MPHDKKLYLLRHATAQPENPCKPDFNRCLTCQGKKELHEVKQYLDHHQDIRPEVILCSKAKRCRQTLTAIQQRFCHSQIILHHFLYLSSVYTLLEILRLLDDNHQTVLIVGHQKTISEVLDFLVRDSCKKQVMFPKGCTCASFIGLDFDDTEKWDEISFKQPILQNIFYP